MNPRLLLPLVMTVAACASTEPEAQEGSLTASDAPVQLDRMGHVEVGPLIIADMTIADRWNREAPFALSLSAEARAEYEQALHVGLIKFDHYDSYPMSLLDFELDTLERIRLEREGETPSADLLDWFDDVEAPHPLSEVYMTDALFVDVSKPCGEGGYLEPELATLAGSAYETCGGRLPNEDVIDRIATVLINGPTDRETRDRKLFEDSPYPDRGDAVEAPYRPASDTFPYLGTPYEGWEDGIL